MVKNNTIDNIGSRELAKQEVRDENHQRLGMLVDETTSAYSVQSTPIEEDVVGMLRKPAAKQKSAMFSIEDEVIDGANETVECVPEAEISEQKDAENSPRAPADTENTTN